MVEQLGTPGGPPKRSPWVDRKIQQNAARSGKMSAHASSMLPAMTRQKKALVIGCGIGGPTVAMALQRAGIEPVVYEARKGSADEAGLFLNAACNGLAVLHTLGADKAVVAAGFPTPRMVMWSGTGKHLGEVANGPTLPSGTVSITIQRGRMHHALRNEALARGIRIEHGKRLIDAHTTAAGVQARFEDGSTAEGDLLIGVDGLHSRTRALVDPGCPAPRYTGQLSLGGIVPSSALSPTPGTYHMIFGKRAFFGYSVTPAGEAYWFANLASATAHEPERGSDHWRQRLREAFRDDLGPALMLVEATPVLEAYPIYDMPTVARWHRGGLVLLGDAAHATSPASGQGAAMALEDALELAKSLRDHGDLEHAFFAYEQLRRPRVERVVRYSARVGNSKLPGPVGRFFRDLMMPLALKLYNGSSAHAWLYRHHIAWSATAP
jgi:FAD-dependent urate hydroxylase